MKDLFFPCSTIPSIKIIIEFLVKTLIKIDFFNFNFLNKDYSFAIEGIDMKF